MIATNIADNDGQLAVAMRQVSFRMPHDLHEALTKHLFNTGRRKFQNFALAAIKSAYEAELQKGKRGRHV